MTTSSQPQGGTILYIEDNPVNLKLMTKQLQRRPEIYLLTAINGEQGLQLARQHRPALILVDIQLPGIDGYQVLKELRQRPETADIRVVAVSANAMTSDISRGMEAGFDDYLTKPVGLVQLFGVIDRLISTDNVADAEAGT